MKEIEIFECINCHESYDKKEIIIHKNGVTEICPVCGLALNTKYIPVEYPK